MRSYLCSAASLLLVGVMGSVVAAQTTMLVAEQIQLEENSFVLEFFDVIEGQEVVYYETTSQILQTDYDLRIETAVLETARFTNYFQDVEPRSTGIGCFFDEPVHAILGIRGCPWQSLYHFTVGGAVEDERIQSRPAYPTANR